VTHAQSAISRQTAFAYGSYRSRDTTPVWKLQYVHFVWQNGT
jgi:hypothetical protein